MLLVGTFAVRGNGYCFVSGEVNHEILSSGEYKLETQDSVFTFPNLIHLSAEYSFGFVSSCNAP